MAGMELELTSERDPDLAALAADWRALEAAADAPSFFQGWSWIGCLAAERYRDPVVVRAARAGRLVGIAIFGSRGDRLHLAESGDPVRDAPFIEHNAPLLVADAGPGCAAAILAAAARDRGAGRLVLSGVAPSLAEVPDLVALRTQDRAAPYLDLQAVRRAGGEVLAVCSANTRHQIRRSFRAYAERGEVALARAATVTEALAWFDALVELHQRSWQARGQRGAFADPFMLRFHRALIEGAMPRGEIDLLRMTAGGEANGYLYNLRLRGWVHAYQSGFDYGNAPPHGKPGMTCHVLAAQRAANAGDGVYDFLAGDDRYKRSLANASRTLRWVELAPRRSAAGLLAAVVQGAAALLPGGRR